MCIFNLFEQVIRNIVLFKNQAAPHLKLRQVPKLGVFLQVIVNMKPYQGVLLQSNVYMAQNLYVFLQRTVNVRSNVIIGRFDNTCYTEKENSGCA